jgi:N-acetylmuramoyl-L-alanine amidase
LPVTVFADAQEKDKPLKGEGIYAFLRRHNRDIKQYYQEFVKLNQEKFGNEQSLLWDVYYQVPPIAGDSIKPDKSNKPDITLSVKNSTNPDKQDTLNGKNSTKPNKPDTSTTAVSGKSAEPNKIKPQPVKKLKTGKQPLFGRKYAEYTIVDQALAGACFFLSSGHGGPDCGAIAKVNGYELHEDEYAYDITLRLARNLLQHGATVYIIIQDPKDGIRDDKYLKNSRKETCMGKPIPWNQMARLQQRTNKINSLSAKAKEKYQRSVFIHLDSRSRKEQLDVFFYYQGKPENRKKSKRLAETMRNTFVDRYANVQPGRRFFGSVSTRYLTVMNNAKPVSIFMELANMQNEFDQRRYIIADNRQALANWMTLGFIQDYRNSK